jgi:eukaryotic-like serine/threonine-protein kinase
MSTAETRTLGDKYRLIHRLREGGMGSVWLAEHLTLKCHVAVKLLAENIAQTELGRQRFLREARTAASLRGEHVVQTIDYGVQDQLSYIVMELLQGESLDDRLRRKKSLSPAETDLVIRHVSRAITSAHEAGIIHRDLKPSNVFLTGNDEALVVKLLDFGIAKNVADVARGVGTRAGAFVGTPMYVSPEQAEGHRPLDHRSDIWSMGAITFECLLGRPPFAGETLGSVLLAICSRPLPIPSRVGPIPPGFDTWFLRACARDPQYRFENARAAYLALRRVLQPSRPAPAPDLGAAAPVRAPEASPAPPVQAPAGGAAPAKPGPQPRSRELGGMTLVAFDSASRMLLSPFTRRQRAVLGAVAALVLSCLVFFGLWARSSVRLEVAVSAPGTLPPLDVEVLLDGRRRCHRAQCSFGGVAAGAHRIEVSARGYQSTGPRSILIPAGRDARHLVRLEPSGDTGIIVRAGGKPEPTVLVDGKDFGKAPCRVLGLDPGEHTISLAGGERYETFRERIIVRPGNMTAVRSVSLKVQRGLATLTPGPGAEGAEIFLQKGLLLEPIAALPAEVEVDTATRHTVQARRNGHAPLDMTLAFEDGQAFKTFEIALQPMVGVAAPSSAEPGAKPRRP